MAYLAPVLIDKATGGKPAGSGALWSSQSLLLWINITQIVLSLVVTCYLYLLARLYTKRQWLASLFVLLSIYPTFLWHYLRAPAHEIYLIFSLLGAGYHFLVFMRRSANGLTKSPRLWCHLLAATLYCSLLVAAKLFFLLFAAVLFAFCLFVGDTPKSIWQRCGKNLCQHFWRYVVYAGIAWLVFMVLLVSLNIYRFNSPIDAGYSQWVNKDGVPISRFTLAIFSSAAPSLLFKAGSKNIFTHYPMMVLALLSLPVLAFRRRQEAYFLGSVFIALTGTLTVYSCWAGEWSYGPRLLVPYLPLVGVAAVAGVDALLDRSRYAAIGLGCIFLWISSVTFMQQVHVNSLHPFVYHYATSQFTQGGLKDAPAIKAYHASIIHRGTLFHDVRAHATRQRLYPPYRELQRIIPANTKNRDQILAQFDGFLKQMGKLNYWFFAEETPK